ncbi:MAG: tRNA 2-thiouridine(34) synthase MnmA [Clostridia bacterium]|nr:tRNA 2-thiouridine(34) synthase MnmA [Clostridia bacterium]
MSKKILVGMSGGVDSSMCAHLLLKDGYEVAGANCRFFNMEDVAPNKACCSEDAVKDAAEVAKRLGIDFYVFDFSKAFRKNVIDNFIDTYVNGATPNPCIECNKHLKFNKMLEKAIEMGFDYIATGHYASIEYNKETNRYLLKKGADEKKDQSYVLYSLNQFQLSHTIFPLGKLLKSEIKETAEKEGLFSVKKGESQDICFVPDGNYSAFIERQTGKAFPEGNFVSTDGKILGTHKGIIRYTIGQRRGLGLALPAPLYVYKKDLKNNLVILSSEDKLFSKELDAENVNFIPFDRLEEPMRVMAKVRYKQAAQWATITQTGENKVHVEFDLPQRAIAKGQAVVFYSGDYVVGGGTII